mmetsp:Transcript_46237/g.86291  ORF Transcript_46237/g.86291 Transcript_46237/m.86291 type:complete len:336 (+) Transcript_46237:10-1017(+)
MQLMAAAMQGQPELKLRGRLAALKATIAGAVGLVLCRPWCTPQWTFLSTVNAPHLQVVGGGFLGRGPRVPTLAASLHGSFDRRIAGAPALLLAGAGGAGASMNCRRRRTNAGRQASTSGEAEATQEPQAQEPQAANPRKGQKDGIQALIQKLKEDPEFQEDVKTFFSSLTVALLIRGFLVEPRFIPSLSMYPNFDIGDQLTVDKISKRWRDYQRRDVVVFNPPPAFSQAVGGDRSGDALIKRIVALAGDTVEVKNGGTLYINGEPQDEPFTNEAARYEFGPVTVPEGCVFVLGDNRNQSLDGHVWGFLPVQNIIGRATLKFWPPWHIGSIAAAPS